MKRNSKAQFKAFLLMLIAMVFTMSVGIGAEAAITKKTFYNTAEPAAIEHANFNMLTPDANGLLPHQYLDIYSWKLQGRNASDFIAIPREGVTLNADGTGEKYISWKCIDQSWITLYKPYYESYINKTPDKIIVEFRAKFQNTVANDNIQVHLNAPGGWPYIAMDTSIVGIPNPTDWHVWKIVFDRASGTATEYVDDVIYSWQYHINPAQISPENISAIWNNRFESVKLVRQSWGSTDPIEGSVLIDYFKVDYSANPTFETLKADGINLTNILQVDGSEITGSFKMQNGYSWDSAPVKILMGMYKIVDGQKILLESNVCYDGTVGGNTIVDITPFALSGMYDFVNDTYEMRFFIWDDMSPYGLVKVITK